MSNIETKELKTGLDVVESRDSDGYREAWERLCNVADEYEFSDNYRIALLTDTEAVLLYNQKLENGCCGFKDWIYQSVDGNYLLGFNYGH